MVATSTCFRVDYRLIQHMIGINSQPAKARRINAVST
jgi:hypothetical protein